MSTEHEEHRPELPRLDLGSGPQPREGFVGVDLRSGERVIGWDLTEFPWPFESETIEALHCSHLIEHLPTTAWQGKDILVRFFEETWRISKPGALFRLCWPAAFDPATGATIPSAWWDPTHYRHIPHQQITSYFWQSGRAALGIEHYRIRCNWAPTRDFVLRNLTVDGSVRELDIELRRDAL